MPLQHWRSEVLQRAGFRVFNVGTVQEALAEAAKRHHDVMLCDVKLPDGSGFQVCREVRALQPHIPVILISAVYRDDVAKQSAVFGGASDYLVEPLTPAELVAAIKRQLG